MKKILEYFHLGRIGFPEFIIALYPVLEGYSYWGVPLRLVLLLLLDVLFLSKKHRRPLDIKAFYVVYFFIIIHEILLWVIIGFPSYLFNTTLQFALTVGSIAIIGFELDYEKFINSVFWVTIVCIGGLIYHYLIIASGGSPTPIKIPFLPAPITEVNRLDLIISRPTSFFQEPAAFGQYMIIPLFLSLKEKKVISTILIALMMFLSTSTNAIFYAVGMVLIYSFLGERIRLIWKMVFLVLAISLVYVVVESDLFVQGFSKIENTDFSENVRVVNGFNYVKALNPEYLILGIPAANPFDYYNDNLSVFSGSDVIVYESSIYMTTIWRVLIKYGIIGLFLFLWMYMSYYKRAKSILPLMVILIVQLFSQSTFFEVCMFTFMATYIRSLRTTDSKILIVSKNGLNI